MLLKCSNLANFMKMEIAMAAMHGAKLSPRANTAVQFFSLVH